MLIYILYSIVHDVYSVVIKGSNVFKLIVRSHTIESYMFSIKNNNFGIKRYYGNGYKYLLKFHKIGLRHFFFQLCTLI